MQDFYLIRHGETDWNVKLGRLQGHTDIPLNEKGLKQAEALSHLLPDLRISKVISSDLQRAFQTARHMTRLQDPHEVTADLREVHLGVGEGLTWDEINLKLGPDFRGKWSTHDAGSLDFRFPEGESRREVLSRVQNCLQNYLQKFKGETLAFVSHGFVIRSLVYHFNPEAVNFFVPNCAVVPFRFENGMIHYRGPKTPDQLLQPRIAD